MLPDKPGPAGPHAARLAVGVVGAGRVGAVLGAALLRAGHDVVGASGVSEDSRDRVAALLPGVPVLDVPDVVARAYLVVLAVPDDALAGLVGGLAATGAFQPGQVVAHTSGAHGIGVLGPALRCGALPMALHPAMTFTGTSMDLDRLPGACFGVTTLDELRPVAEALVLEMGAEPVWVPEAERVRYHAGLAHGSNGVTTLLSQAAQVLRDAGVEDPARLLRPLVLAAVDNALRDGDRALTGPVARGDAGTVRGHLAVLADEPGDVAAVYRALSGAAVDRAVADRRLAPHVADLLRAALGERAHDRPEEPARTTPSTSTPSEDPLEEP